VSLAGRSVFCLWLAGVHDSQLALDICVTDVHKKGKKVVQGALQVQCSSWNTAPKVLLLQEFVANVLIPKKCSFWNTAGQKIWHFMFFIYCNNLFYVRL
jgi:hypothetical protein